MLDAIEAIDNLGMEAATDISPTSLESTVTMDESQGSSLQEMDFNQALMEMMSSLDTAPEATNPSLKVVSGQSLEEALADVIPGLDPTTVTPADPLAAESGSNLSNFDDPELLGEAFQSVSDGFEGLSNSFEQLAASFLSQDGSFDTVATLAVSAKQRGTEGDDTNADLPVTSSDDAQEKGIVTPSSDDLDTPVDDGAIGKSDDEMNADFDISKMLNGKDSNALDMDFDLDFDALKVNVDQVSRGLQFLVQQLKAAFESDSLTLRTPSRV
jgi:hypothetical protein